VFFSFRLRAFFQVLEVVKLQKLVHVQLLVFSNLAILHDVLGKSTPGSYLLGARLASLGVCSSESPFVSVKRKAETHLQKDVLVGVVTPIAAILRTDFLTPRVNSLRPSQEIRTIQSVRTRLLLTTSVQHASKLKHVQELITTLLTLYAFGAVCAVLVAFTVVLGTILTGPLQKLRNRLDLCGNIVLRAV